jgi:hypothetical protein
VKGAHYRPVAGENASPGRRGSRRGDFRSSAPYAAFPIECEGVALDGVSPALRAWASDFGKTRFLLNIRPKVFSPGKPSASRIPSPPSSGRTDRRTRHIPAPPAAAPSSMTALLTR